MNGKEGSRHSARALRNIARVDYKSLHRGKSQKCKIMSSIEEEPQSDTLMGDMSSLDGASGGLGDSLHAKPRSGEGDVSGGDDDLEMLRMEREMRSLKEEERRLTMASKKDTMRRQLEMQRQKVQNLRGTTSVFISGSGTKTEKSKSKLPVSHEISSGREKDDDCEIDELTIQQLRADDKLRHKVQKELKKHGLLSDMSSSSSSESSSSEDSSSENEKKKKKKHKHKKKSGIKAKASDKVRHPQKWPHAHLQYEHVNKQVKYDELDFKLFIAGELEIISEDGISSTERQGRLKLLKKIVYFYATYEFKGLKAFYAAWLREIELGKKSWADDSQLIESAILTKYILKGSASKSLAHKSGGKAAGKQSDEDRTWFCSSYQRNKCAKKSNHLDTINGRMRLQSHICATCWLKDKAKLEHPECSSACPHASH